MMPFFFDQLGGWGTRREGAFGLIDGTEAAAEEPAGAAGGAPENTSSSGGSLRGVESRRGDGAALGVGGAALGVG